MAVMERGLGRSSHNISAFSAVRYGLSIWTDGTPTSAWHDAFRGGLAEAVGYVEAAIYELGLMMAGGDEPVDQRAFDPDLWDHVKGVVGDEDWAKVAGLVAIFVEDRVRTWAGHPKDTRTGEDLVGKGLYSAVFANDSEYRLGRRSGEWEGWRMLGMGFAQAVGNVDRHRLQDRADARRYALGVLGLGSLLLTQLRYEHGDHLHDE